MGPDAMILVFWMLSFKPTFPLSSFTFKRLFSSSLLYNKGGVICVSSSLYNKGGVICISEVIDISPGNLYSSLAFLMMHSAYKLNGWQYTAFSYLEPVCCSMYSSNCCFFTCVQISQEAGQVVWYSYLFKNFKNDYLEYVAIPFSRGSSQPRDWTQVSCIAGGFFTIWATREAHRSV